MNTTEQTQLNTQGNLAVPTSYLPIYSLVERHDLYSGGNSIHISPFLDKDEASATLRESYEDLIQEIKEELSDVTEGQLEETNALITDSDDNRYSLAIQNNLLAIKVNQNPKIEVGQLIYSLVEIYEYNNGEISIHTSPFLNEKEAVEALNKEYNSQAQRALLDGCTLENEHLEDLRGSFKDSQDNFYTFIISKDILK